MRGEVSLVARSPLAGQISLGGTGRWNRYRAPPGPPFDLSATNLRRLGRTLSPEDTAPRSRRRAGRTPFDPKRASSAGRSGESVSRSGESKATRRADYWQATSTI